MSSRVALVTGSQRADRLRGGRASSTRAAGDVARRRQQHAPRLLRRRTATRPGTSSASARVDDALHAPRARHPRPRGDAGARRPRDRPDLIVHCAAQPSHDLAATGPFDDFDVNAVGTLNLLEAARRSVPGVAVRLHDARTRSTATRRTSCALVELETRWDYADPADCRRHRRDAAASTRRCTASSARPRWRPT